MLFTSANYQYVETLDLFRLNILCGDITGLMLWSGLGTKSSQLSFKKSYVLP